MSARGVRVGVGVSFGAEEGCGSDSEQSNRQFSYVRGFGGFVFVLALAGWQVLVSVLSDLELGLGTRRKGPMELSWLKFFCACGANTTVCMHVIVAVATKRQDTVGIHAPTNDLRDRERGLRPRPPPAARLVNRLLYDPAFTQSYYFPKSKAKLTINYGNWLQLS